LINRERFVTQSVTNYFLFNDLSQKCGKLFACFHFVTTFKNMKEKNNLKSVLGISQEDMAIVLGITRSHCAMIEARKRDLPLNGLQELANILQYTKGEHFNDTEIQSLIKEEELRIQKIFEQEMELNKYKIHVLSKKIEKAERLRNESLAALRLAEYLDTQTDNPRTVGMSEVIKPAAMQTLKRNNELLRKHTISKETLIQQSKIFEKELKDEAGFSFFRDSRKDL
jgi:transcriptional regulator with XRE-family HTH domain